MIRRIGKRREVEGVSMIAVLYLTPAQLCARWLGRISEKTLANWRSGKKGPRYKRFGSRILYPSRRVRVSIVERLSLHSVTAMGLLAAMSRAMPSAKSSTSLAGRQASITPRR